MFCIAIRTFDWALEKEPLVRYLRPANSAPSIIMDVLDLAVNLRGHGWNWSHSLYIPRDMRPTNRMAFACSTFLSAVGHASICGVLHRAILSYLGVGSITNGFTIFDDTLPFLLRYLRASIISILTAFAAYTSLQMGYDLCTIPAVLFLGTRPRSVATCIRRSVARDIAHRVLGSQVAPVEPPRTASPGWLSILHLSRSHGHRPWYIHCIGDHA